MIAFKWAEMLSQPTIMPCFWADLAKIHLTPPKGNPGGVKKFSHQSGLASWFPLLDQYSKVPREAKFFRRDISYAVKTATRLYSLYLHEPRTPVPNHSHSAPSWTYMPLVQYGEN